MTKLQGDGNVHPMTSWGLYVYVHPLLNLEGVTCLCTHRRQAVKRFEIMDINNSFFKSIILFYIDILYIIFTLSLFKKTFKIILL
jgi:hypothetical protein